MAASPGAAFLSPAARLGVGAPPRRGVREPCCERRIQSEVVGFGEVAPASRLQLPVGMLCPFRSQAVEDMQTGVKVAEILAESMEVDAEFQQIAMAANQGMQLDSRQLRATGCAMVDMGARLGKVLDQLERSKDFQATEMYYLWEAQAAHVEAPSIRFTQRLVNWQGNGLIAMAEGEPQPPEPEGFLDFVRIQKERANSGAGPPPALKMDGSADFPFDDEDLSGDFGAAYRALMEAHQMHVVAGSQYGDFDQLGKEMYLDKMADIRLRWEELFAASEGVGVRPTRGFQEASSEYARTSQAGTYGTKQIVEDVHARMRAMASGGEAAR